MSNTGCSTCANGYCYKHDPLNTCRKCKKEIHNCTGYCFSHDPKNLCRVCENVSVLVNGCCSKHIGVK